MVLRHYSTVSLFSFSILFISVSLHFFFSFSLFSFHLVISVSLLLCGVFCVVLCCCVLCCVVLCRGVCLVCGVWYGTLKKPWKKPCVDPNTPPRVDSKRPRVYQQHVHNLMGSTQANPFDETTRMIQAKLPVDDLHVDSWPEMMRECEHARRRRRERK